MALFDLTDIVFEMILNIIQVDKQFFTISNNN